MPLFKRNLLSKRLCLGREPTQASWEKGENKSIYLETNKISIMLEMFFSLLYIHIYDKSPQTPTSLSWKKLMCSKVLSCQEKEHSPFVPKKEGPGKGDCQKG